MRATCRMTPPSNAGVQTLWESSGKATKSTEATIPTVSAHPAKNVVWSAASNQTLVITEISLAQGRFGVADAR